MLSNRQEMYKTNKFGYSNIIKRGNSYQVQITIRKKLTSKSFKTLGWALLFRNFIKNNI